MSVVDTVFILIFIGGSVGFFIGVWWDILGGKQWWALRKFKGNTEALAWDVQARKAKKLARDAALKGNVEAAKRQTAHMYDMQRKRDAALGKEGAGRLSLDAKS